MATISAVKIPQVGNEPNRHYKLESDERKALSTALAAFKSRLPLEIPLVISGEDVNTTAKFEQKNPAHHSVTVAHCSGAGRNHVTESIEGALAAKPAWESLPFGDRAAVFLRAADLISTKYRYDIMAATMVGQGKNTWQAEIDAAAELVDFLRLNVRFAEELYGIQPPFNSSSVWNQSEYRPVEGFVYAVTPFNFTAIAGNLCAAPALLGNVVIWKPSPHSMASNYLIHQIFKEAGLPDGVIQFVPGDAVEITQVVLNHPQFAGLHFTGSTAVFRNLYGQIGQGIAESRFKGYPRIVGETGGKNSHTAHKSANVPNAVFQTIRAAFEFQGQKCSACSRLYAPRSRWPEIQELLVSETEKLKIGPPEDFESFVGPVIHEASFDKLASVIDTCNKDPNLQLLVGGKHDKSEGYYIHPTIYLAQSPDHHNFGTEFFGPILTVYVYDDMEPASFVNVLKLVDATSPYGLTAAIFAEDRLVVRQATDVLRNTAGNFYINCKCTGAVVGQQPFGGARASGTNDKAGSAALLQRFVSQRSIKEEFLPTEQVLYPSNSVTLRNFQR